jgi:hypothetical protein
MQRILIVSLHDVLGEALRDRLIVGEQEVEPAPLAIGAPRLRAQQATPHADIACPSPADRSRCSRDPRLQAGRQTLAR